MVGEDAENSLVVPVGKRRLEQVGWFHGAVVDEVVDDLVDERDLIGRQRREVEEVGKSFLRGIGIETGDLPDEPTRGLVSPVGWKSRRSRTHPRRDRPVT